MRWLFRWKRARAQYLKIGERPEIIAELDTVRIQAKHKAIIAASASCIPVVGVLELLGDHHPAWWVLLVAVPTFILTVGRCAWNNWIYSQLPRRMTRAQWEALPFKSSNPGIVSQHGITEESGFYPPFEFMLDEQTVLRRLLGDHNKKAVERVGPRRCILYFNSGLPTNKIRLRANAFEHSLYGWRISYRIELNGVLEADFTIEGAVATDGSVQRRASTLTTKGEPREIIINRNGDEPRDGDWG